MSEAQKTCGNNEINAKTIAENAENETRSKQEPKMNR
jgi:hypothetical protein